MLFKKMIAAASATAITLSVVAPVTSVSADSASIEAANKLAASGVINDQSSNPAAYNLDSEITRQEIAKVIVNLSGATVQEGCEGKFADVPATGIDAWACPFIETALENDFISANANFNPKRNVSKWESMKLVLRAKGFDKAEGYDMEQEAYVMAALDLGIISEAFTDYDTPAKRGFIFGAAANTMMEEEVVVEEDEDDIFGDLFGDDEDTEVVVDEEETTTEEDNSPVVSIDEDMLQVELSPMSPANGERIPRGTPRVTMMVLDVTAGTDDVELKTVKLEAAGFGDSADINDVVVYDENGEKVSRQRSINSDDEVDLDFINEFTVKAGETVSLTVAAQIDSSASNGDVFALNVVELEASSDVEGAPVEGAELEAVAISNQGEIVVKADAATSDVTVGDEAKLAGLKVKNDNDKEDIMLKTIRLQQTGSIDEDYISDMYVTVDGEKQDIDLEFSKEYVTINFGEGFELPRERSSYYNIELHGTITGEPTKTVKFIIEEADDIYAVGSKLGYNTPVKNTSDADFAGDLALSDTLTVEGSAIEVSFEKASKDASNVDVDDFNFGTLKLTSTTSDYTLEDYTIKLTVTRADDDIETTDLLENIKLGGLSTDSNLTHANLTDLDNGAESIDFNVTFEDITLRKGESKVLPLTADIPKDVAKGQVSYQFDLSFNGIDANSDGDTEDGGDTASTFTLKDEDNNESYTTVAEVKDIFSAYSGLDTRSVDVEGADLKISIDNISNEEIVLGSSTAVVVKGDIEAGSAADVKINELVFTNVDAAKVADLEDVIAKATLTIGDETIESTDIAATTITFDSLSEVIKAGSSNKTDFEVSVQFKKADDTAITATTADKVSFKVSNVEAEDNEVGTELTFNAADIDDSTKDATAEDSSSNTVTLSTKGTIEYDVDVTKDDANVEQFDKARYALAGTSKYKLAKVDLEADKENVQVKKLTFTDDFTAKGGAAAASNAKNSVENIQLMRGSSVVANADVSVSGSTLTVEFDDIDSLYVETEKETFYIVADIKAIDLGETGGNAESGVAYDLTLSAYEFEGENSSDLLTGANVTATNSAASKVTIIASDVASISVDKASTKPTANQFFEVAYINVAPASNTNEDANGDPIKPLFSQIILDEDDFVFTGVTGLTQYNVRVRNVDTDELVSAATTQLSGATTIAIDQGSADDREIDGTTKFAIEVEIAATSVDTDSSYSIKVDREAVQFSDGVNATFNEIYKSGAVVSK